MVDAETTRATTNAKRAIADFWETAACGEDLYLTSRDAEGYQAQRDVRYRLEPYVLPFIDAESWRGKRVLEIGVGLGSDHELLAAHGAELSGIDLTERAVARTSERLRNVGFRSDLRVGDAENLPYPDCSFDMVYSWGVIHHTPDTTRAAREILRVLSPGGQFKVMIYNKWCLIGLMLWTRYALLKGRPFTSLSEIYSKHLESPGTKAYTPAEAAQLFAGADVKTAVVLTHGDLLESSAGQRHRGLALTFAKALWPRWLLRRVARNYGLFLLIDGRKAMGTQ